MRISISDLGLKRETVDAVEVFLAQQNGDLANRWRIATSNVMTSVELLERIRDASGSPGATYELAPSTKKAVLAGR